MKSAIKSLVEALRKVPEKTFRISELAPQLIDDKGKVDIDKAQDQAGEIDTAVAEVENYIKATRNLRDNLLGVRKSGETGDYDAYLDPNADFDEDEDND